MSLKIIQGEDRTLTVLLKKSDGTAYDVSTATEIQADFCDVVTPGTISKTLTGTDIVVQAQTGQITIKLGDADTPLLDVGTQGFTITVTEASGDLRKINLANSIIVEEAIC